MDKVPGLRRRARPARRSRSTSVRTAVGRRSQGTQEHRRSDPVPARSGRPRTRRAANAPESAECPSASNAPTQRRPRGRGISPPKRRPFWEAIFAKYAAPGMCNPDDVLNPCTSQAHPSQAQIDNDHRSLAQRRHDAHDRHRPHCSNERNSGHLNGLPVSIIIRTTLQDLRIPRGCGRDRWRHDHAHRST